METSAAAADRSAIKAASRVCDAWRLTSAQSEALLGEVWDLVESPDHDEALSSEQRMRIGHLLAIYADLHALFASSLADQWPTRANTNTLFAGRTPVEVMGGDLESIAAVRDLLDARLQQ